MGVAADATLLERLRVFVASPGDVAAEREHVKTVADELNRGIAAQAGFVLDVVRWETHARPDMGRAEQLILDQIGQCDLFVGIMWRRFGTPTGVAGSGTEEEFDHALRAWRRSGQPRMLCYFSRARGEPPETVEEATQLHLQQILLREFVGRRPPLDRNLLALLEVEKERCHDRDVTFVTPNLLVALLGARTGAARRIVDRARPGAVEALVASLRRYEPLDNGGAVRPFEDFDWYDRSDVQAARRRAQLEAARAIDARHLLLGFLDTPGETRSALRQALGDEGFERLIRTAEASDQADGTPGIGDFLVVPQAPGGD